MHESLKKWHGAGTPVRSVEALGFRFTVFKQFACFLWAAQFWRLPFTHIAAPIQQFISEDVDEEFAPLTRYLGKPIPQFVSVVRDSSRD